MNNKSTNSILHSPFCFQQKDVHLNQKGFSLVGALIGGVISLIIIGTVNDLVLRSIKSSNKAEKAIHTLNDKQRIINWFDNELICAETLKNYPMNAAEKRNGIKVLYNHNTEFKIKNPQGNVLENFNPGSSNSVESIVIRKTNENNYALFFYEKSSNSENPLYERKPQKADQIIVACGSTTPTGDYVIDKCGSSCVSKCNSDQQLSPEGLCVPISTCTGGREEQIDDDGNTTCKCPNEEDIFDEINNECRKGKDCDTWLSPQGVTYVYPTNMRRKFLHNTKKTYDSYCKNTREDGFFPYRAWCITEQGYSNGFTSGKAINKGSANYSSANFNAWLVHGQWTFFCYDGQVELLEDPYKPGGECTTEGFIAKKNREEDDPNKHFKPGDVISWKKERTSEDSPSTRCYRYYR